MSEYSAEKQKIIGNRISEKIYSLGLKRVDVAKDAKMSYANLKKIIDGNNYPTGSQILKLCELLKITPNYLLFGEEKLDFSSNERKLSDGLVLGYMVGKLDSDDQKVIERLVSSMLLSKHKRSEYEKIIHFAKTISSAITIESAMDAIPHDVMDELKKYQSES